MVELLKRIMKFSVFRLAEYAERQPQFKEGQQKPQKFVIKIARHKTAGMGPSLVYITPAHEAPEAHVKFYRQITVEFSSPDCYVFPSSSSPQRKRCCGKINDLGFGQSHKKSCSSSRGWRVNHVKNLRRSQITALWEENRDSSWRSKVADQCAYALSSTRGYYDYSSKVKPGMEVVEKLTSIHERA